MGESALDEERLNLAIRKFLKVVGINSQREIETAIRDAVAAGSLSADGAVQARVTLELPGLGVTRVIDEQLKIG